MSTLRKVIDGLTLIEKYEPTAWIAVEHDQIWAGTYSDARMPAEDRTKMKRLGWKEDASAWSLEV